MLNFILNVLISGIIFLIFCIILGLIVEYFAERNRPCILVDFDILADATAVYNRSVIYAQEDLQKQMDYLVAHISEQVPIPKGLRKIIGHLYRGRKLIFMSSRHECLRIETAKFLNDWQLPGELYMNNGMTQFKFKHSVCCELHKRKLNVIGVIDSNIDGKTKDLYDKFKIKVI